MQASDIVIEKMSQEDLSQIAMLESVCFSSPWSQQALFSELSNPLARFFVAKDGDKKVLGYIGSLFVAGEASITNVAVFPQHRRCGVASKLLSFLIDTARSENIMQIFLEVRKSNTAAVSLYEKQGFSVCGERKGFYTKPVEDAVLMTYRNITD